MSKKNASGRSPGKTQISISLPQDLVERIDRLADSENRNRSNFIATHLERMAADVEEDVVGEPGSEFRKKKLKV